MPDFEIPTVISNDENIARNIFSPININPKRNQLKANCLKPPANSDEVSVNRYDYTTADFLKRLGLKMQSDSKQFFGLAIFKCEAAREVDFDVVYTPINGTEEEKNDFHADLKIGYTVIRDTELPSRISHAIKNLLKNTKLYIDTNIHESKWVGDDISILE